MENYVVIISHTGAGILHNKDQAIGLKRFFPNHEFKEVETYEGACRWAEKALAERYPGNVYRRHNLSNYSGIYCLFLREQTEYSAMPDKAPSCKEGELPLVLTVAEAGEALRIGRTAAYSIVRCGKLRSVRVGRTIRVPRDAIAEFLRA